MVLTLTVHMHPVGKARARVVSGHAYTPDGTRVAEETIAALWKQKHPRRKPFARTEPLILEVDAYFTTPQKKREYPTGKPDASNILKLVEDALSGGLAYEDDAQIISTRCNKTYVEGPPWLYIVLSTVE